ncbi:MAG: glycoside hydrolase domain-containing protein [Planctomycetota bacterium]
MFRKCVFLALLLFSVFSLGVADADESPWHLRFYKAGKGYWKGRVRVDVRNTSERKIEGDSISLTVGKGDGRLDLSGEEIKALRVCDAQGEELLYELLDTQQRPKTIGALADGDTLAFAVECDPQGSTVYHIYYDNPDAEAVDDFWRANVPLLNGGFEDGGETPAGWTTWGEDDTHHLSWVKESPCDGGRCVKCVVAAGAEPTWVKYGQYKIPLTSGKEYVLKACVKGKDVKGRAGFFIHVNGEKPMIMNQSADAGEGTYDWKELEIRFTTPPDAKDATVGTILSGTGTAWYDEFRLERADASQPAQVSVGKKESLTLQKITVADAWLKADAPNGPVWEYRLGVTLLNMSDQAAQNALASVDLNQGLKGAFRKANLDSVRVVDSTTAAVCPHLLQDNTVLFQADLPARSEKTYHVYVSCDKRIKPGKMLSGDDLVSGKTNLVKNPSFEQGDAEWQRQEGMSKIDGGARSGQKCIRLDVPADAKAGWRGHHQTIAVEPNATYLYSGFLKTKGVDGKATLHLHQHNKDHKQIKGQWGFSTRPDVSGDADWTQTSAVLQTSGETRFVALHLTMDCHGTLWHDDIVFCRMIPAILGDLETRPGADAAERKGPVAMWLVNPVVKVFREDIPDVQLKEIEAQSARNEYEPIQLVLRSARDLSDVSVKVEPPANAKGEKLANVKVELVGYVPIDYPTSYYQSNQPPWYRLYPKAPPRCDGWAGDWPDPLRPYEPFDLKANQSQPVWITVRVPDGAAPGEYNGQVVVEARGAFHTAVRLRVHVWDFVLPKDTRLRVIYDLRFHSLRHLYPDAESLRPWYKFMADHRVCTDRFQPEMNITYKDGKVELDTKGFDEAAHYCLDVLGMNSFYTHHMFYAFGWAYPPRKVFGFEAFTPEYKEALRKSLTAYMDHLRAKGWDKKALCYVSDEPHFSHDYVVTNLATYCKLIAEIEPNLLTYSSTWRYVPGYVGALKAWGVGAYGCFPVEKMEERRQAGDTLIFTTDGQMCIDTPYCGIERLLPYFCWKYHVVGYEFWGISWWTYDPWEKGYHQYISQASAPDQPRYNVRYPNGDGYLLYPGKRFGVNGPVSSVRMEQAREGVEDYEYFVILNDLIARAKAKGLATADAEVALNRVNEIVSIPNKGGCYSTDILPDPDAPVRTRRAIGEQIEKLDKVLHGK